MCLLEFGGVLTCQPAMTVGRHRWLQEEVVAEGEAEREFVMIWACVKAEREGGRSVDGHAAARHGDVAQHQVMRRVLLVDEDDVLDLRTRLPSLIGYRVIALVALVTLIALVALIALIAATITASALGEAVIRVDARCVRIQLLRVWQRDDVHGPQHGELG